jgi:hypothetical protein
MDAAAPGHCQHGTSFLGLAALGLRFPLYSADFVVAGRRKKRVDPLLLSSAARKSAVVRFQAKPPERTAPDLQLISLGPMRVAKRHTEP